MRHPSLRYSAADPCYGYGAPIGSNGFRGCGTEKHCCTRQFRLGLQQFTTKQPTTSGEGRTTLLIWCVLSHLCLFSPLSSLFSTLSSLFSLLYSLLSLRSSLFSLSLRSSLFALLSSLLTLTQIHTLNLIMCNCWRCATAGDAARLGRGKPTMESNATKGMTQPAS
jgi:hypothetical protein